MREVDNNILFLNILINQTNTGTLEIQIYRQPSITNQMLNNTSNNSTVLNRICAQTLLERAETH